MTVLGPGYRLREAFDFDGSQSYMGEIASQAVVLGGTQLQIAAFAL